MPIYGSGVDAPLVSRAREDELLAFCDGTCAAGAACVCLTELGARAPGARVAPGSVDLCVPCARARTWRGEMANPYLSYDADYADEALATDEEVEGAQRRRLSGCFVRYRASDYRLFGPVGLSLEQHAIPRAPTKPRWLENLFTVIDVETALRDGGDPALLPTHARRAWRVCVCPRPGCQPGVLTSRTAGSRDVGVGHAALDLSRGEVVCTTCGSTVSCIAPDPETMVACTEFEGHAALVQCIFCSLVIDFDPRRTAQACQHCLADLLLQNSDLHKICHYCRVPLVSSRRMAAGCQVCSIQTPQGEVVEIYLCRKHRLRGAAAAVAASGARELEPGAPGTPGEARG